MHPSYSYRRSRSAAGRGSVLLLVLLGCGEPITRGVIPDDVRHGKAPSAGPTVSAVSPTSAYQDTTLDLTVTGSGFDRGTRAELALAGVVDPAKVRTNVTRYVSAKQLVVNITISRDAAEALYDIIVTTSTGKKGVGTEKFAVQRKPEMVSPSMDLGTLGGAGGRAHDINALGHIVGASDRPDGSVAAFFWESGALVELPIPADAAPNPSGLLSFANGINDSDVIAGHYYKGNGRQLAVRWVRVGGLWTIEELPPLPGHDGSTANAINATGDVLGRSFVAGDNGSPVPVIWRDGIPYRLTMPASWTGVLPDGLNDAGWITGIANPDGTGGTAFVWIPDGSGVSGAGTASLLPEVGATLRWGKGINANGDVVGYVSLSSALTAVRYSRRADGTYEGILLGQKTSIAVDISDSGIVVGHVGNVAQGARWLASNIMQTLIPLPGFVAAEVMAVNASGVAVGTSRSSGESRVTVWPAP